MAQDKASACSAGDLGSIPGLGRSPGEGNGNPLQYSCLENPMDRGAWQATVHGVTVGHDWVTSLSFTYAERYFMSKHFHPTVHSTLTTLLFIIEYIYRYVCMLSLQSCPTLWPYGLTNRLLCPWDSPGKNTGVGCHTLICMYVYIHIHLKRDIYIYTHTQVIFNDM